MRFGMVRMKIIGLTSLLVLTVVSTVTARSEVQSLPATDPDSVVYYPGTFQWDERTVVQPPPALTAKVTRYLDIVDHVNVDFGDAPESVIRLTLEPITGKTSFEILVLEDTIDVTAATPEALEYALHRLKQMKKEGERKSPDYGLIYIRCGLYRFDKF